MNDESSMLKAARILVLVGTIMALVSAVLMLALMFGMGALFAADDSAESAAVGGLVLAVYGVIAVMSFAGAAFGFLSYRACKEGDVHAAWVRGLIASLLPPVQVVMLLGAILALVSPEHGEWEQVRND